MSIEPGQTMRPWPPKEIDDILWHMRWQGHMLWIGPLIAIIVFLSLLAFDACGADCSWCFDENRIDFKRDRDDCISDYYSERAYCWGDDEKNACTTEASTDRRACIMESREIKSELDGLCRRVCE